MGGGGGGTIIPIKEWKHPKDPPETETVTGCSCPAQHNSGAATRSQLLRFPAIVVASRITASLEGFRV